MAVQIQMRRGTAAQWTAANPTLAEGEIGTELDTGYFKVGNGSTAWNSLTYSQGLQGPEGDAGQGVPTGGTAGQVLAKIDGTNYNTEWINPPAGGGGSGVIDDTLVFTYYLSATGSDENDGLTPSTAFASCGPIAAAIYGTLNIYTSPIELQIRLCDGFNGEVSLDLETYAINDVDIYLQIDSGTVDITNLYILAPMCGIADIGDIEGFSGGAGVACKRAWLSGLTFAGQLSIRGGAVTLSGITIDGEIVTGIEIGAYEYGDGAVVNIDGCVISSDVTTGIVVEDRSNVYVDSATTNSATTKYSVADGSDIIFGSQYIMYPFRTPALVANKMIATDAEGLPCLLDIPEGGSTDAVDIIIDDVGENFTATNVEGALAELFQSVSDGKDSIASAITGKGGTADGDDTFSELADAITALPSGGADGITTPEYYSMPYTSMSVTATVA